MKDQKHNLKDLEVNEETLAIDALHSQFVEDAIEELDDVCGDLEPDAIECHSRDGFMPYSHNQGGYSAHIYMGIWSGGFNSAIQKEIDSSLEYIEEQGKEEFGKDYDPCNNNEHGNWESESLSECQLDMFYIEARAMFHGFDNGVYSTSFQLIARVSDAPYFRHADSVAEYTIEYKDAKELEQKLKSLKVLDALTDHISKGDDKDLDLAA